MAHPDLSEFGVPSAESHILATNVFTGTCKLEINLLPKLLFYKLFHCISCRYTVCTFPRYICMMYIWGVLIPIDFHLICLYHTQIHCMYFPQVHVYNLHVIIRISLNFLLSLTYVGGSLLLRSSSTHCLTLHVHLSPYAFVGTYVPYPYPQYLVYTCRYVYTLPISPRYTYSFSLLGIWVPLFFNLFLKSCYHDSHKLSQCNNLYHSPIGSQIKGDGE